MSNNITNTTTQAPSPVASQSNMANKDKIFRVLDMLEYKHMEYGALGQLVPDDHINGKFFATIGDLIIAIRFIAISTGEEETVLEYGVFLPSPLPEVDLIHGLRKMREDNLQASVAVRAA